MVEPIEVFPHVQICTWDGLQWPFLPRLETTPFPKERRPLSKTVSFNTDLNSPVNAVSKTSGWAIAEHFRVHSRHESFSFRRPKVVGIHERRPI